MTATKVLDLSREQKLEHLNHLHLKTILKESHCSSVHQLVFNPNPPVAGNDMTNMFATVGKDQATIYDDRHFGKFVDIVAQFVNEKTEYASGGELLACCWLSGKASDEEFGDALLAVGGEDAAVSVVSLVQSRVVSLLKTPGSRAVVEVCACDARPNWVAAVTRDEKLRVWDWTQEACLFTIQAGGSVAAFHWEGKSLFTGNSQGHLLEWKLPDPTKLGEKRKREGSSPQTIDSKDCVKLTESLPKESRHSLPLDCIRHLPEGRLVTKSVDGRVCVWDHSGFSKRLDPPVMSVKVPGCAPSSNTRSLFGLSPSGEFLVAGNTSGDLFVFDTQKGTRLATLKHTKVSEPVRACAITDDCTHVLAVYGAGFIWRYEYIAPPVDSNVEDKESEPDVNADLEGS